MSGKNEGPVGLWGRADEYARRLKRLALRLCQGDAESACDLAHQVLASAAQCDGLDANGNLWPYLRTALVNHYVDKKRLQQREVSLIDDEPPVDGALHIETRFVQHEVRRILSGMPEKQAEILRLVYTEGYTLEEVATRMELTSEAVKQRLKRARGRFKAVCKKMEVVFE